MADANPATVLLEASKQQSSKQARKQTARKQTARKQEASKETGREQANSEQEASVKYGRSTNRCAYLSSRFGPENSNYWVPRDHFGFHFGIIWEDKVKNREDKVRNREDKEPNEKKRGFGDFCPMPWRSQF